MDDRFHFTVTDLARFLGKSPVTLRGWERQGIIKFPRDPKGGDRKFTCDDIIDAAEKAHKLHRVSHHRVRLIYGAMGALTFIETIGKRKR